MYIVKFFCKALIFLDFFPKKVVLPTSLLEIEKVKTTLRQIVRDWSAEGSRERDVCYRPVLDELKRLYCVKQRHVQ